MESVAIGGEKAGVSSEKKDPIGLIDNICLQWLHVLKFAKMGHSLKHQGPLQN